MIQDENSVNITARHERASKPNSIWKLTICAPNQIPAGIRQVRRTLSRAPIMSSSASCLLNTSAVNWARKMEKTNIAINAKIAR
jgi:hypothetical protein